MSSLIFNSALTDEATGQIDYDSDAFSVLLVGAAYTADQVLHRRRSDLSDEIAGAGYSAGGSPAAVTVLEDGANNRVNITLGAVIWPVATIAAAGAVYYKNRGGAAGDDELVAFVDFGGIVSSTDGAFTLSESTIRKQN